MIEPTEELSTLSKSDEIALEDGEIEEEEVAEPIVETVETILCEESEIIETDNLNDSDVDVCDRLAVKSKKHKHHKKRKRQLSSDEISTTDSRKKQKSNDDFSENVSLQGDNKPSISDHEDNFIADKDIEKCAWNHDSDNEDSNKIPSSNIEDRGFSESAPPKDDNSGPNSPVMKEKWGNDSDEDSSKPKENKPGENISSNDWTNESKGNWSNKNDSSNSYDNNQENKSDWNNRNDENKGWGNRNDDNKGWGNRSDDNKGWGNRNDDNKGWGNRNDNNKGWGNRNDDNNSWRNKGDNNNDWNNRGDDNKGWGNRNDDNDGGGGYRRGGRNNWGNRNDDRNNRGFRNRGRGNWRNRNDDNNFGNRNRGGGDWNNRGRDNDSWGNKNSDNNDWNNKNKDNDDDFGCRNRDNNDWGNKNKSNDDWGNKNKDNDDWGNKNKDNDDWGNKNKDNDDWGNKTKETNNGEDKVVSDNNEDFAFKSDEVVEKQAWGHTSDDEDSPSIKPVIEKQKDSFVSENKKDFFTPCSNDEEIKEPAVVPPVKLRDIDDFGKWGGSDSEEESTQSKPMVAPQPNTSMFRNEDEKTFDKPDNKGSPEAGSKWNAYDSDDEASTTKPSTFKPQSSFNDNNSGFNGNNSFGESGGNKWNSPAKQSFNKWGGDDGDNDRRGGQRDQNDDNSSRGNYNNFGNRNNRNDNNRNDNYNRNDNNRNDNFGRSDRGRNSGGGDRGGGGGKKWPCKYFLAGSCHRGDSCIFIHDSPVKSQSHEPKVQELCRFYEHQECYKRNMCAFMHEEFPCKLFHAGSKMCPSGDSCKYSHAPLNQETKAMLEKYLDEKIDERTDKSASGSLHDNSDYKTNVSTPFHEEMMPNSDQYFQDPMSRMYPQAPHDPMKFPIRPWNNMMHYGDMPVPPQMEFMQRQRFMYDRLPQAMPGRMMHRGYRGMMHNANPVGQMHHDPYAGNPYTVTPLMSVYPKISDMKDPYIDNLAQIVVGKESYGPNKDPCGMKRDMMDPGMCVDDDMNDYPLDNDCGKRSMPSPLKINSPEIPPGAYVPRTSMNAVQPNVRLGSGLPYGNEAAMMYGGYPGHPNESAAMMDYINMAAIHYYHNKPEQAANYDRPWKLVVLDVPVKVPYPLMQIEVGDLPHRYIDPRLRGHPSVLNSGGGGNPGTQIQPTEHGGSMMPRDGPGMMMQQQQQTEYGLASSSSINSQLSSPLAGSDCPSSSDLLDRQLSSSFHYRACDQDSPVFPLSEDAFSFLGTDDVTKRVLDRSYLQDPRFKRKKVVAASTTGGGDME